MRLFVAICLSPEIRETLVKAQQTLRSQGGQGRYTLPENFHLTLAFLGETENVAGAIAALQAACTCAPFPLTMAGWGRFDDLRWVGVAPNPRLRWLARRVQSALRQRGFSLEIRPFIPHVTLVRRLTGEGDGGWIPPVKMRVDRVSLLCSEQLAGRQIYREIFGRTLEENGKKCPRRAQNRQKKSLTGGNNSKSEMP